MVSVFQKLVGSASWRSGHKKIKVINTTPLPKQRVLLAKKHACSTVSKVYMSAVYYSLHARTYRCKKMIKRFSSFKILYSNRTEFISEPYGWHHMTPMGKLYYLLITQGAKLIYKSFHIFILSYILLIHNGLNVTYFGLTQFQHNFTDISFISYSIHVPVCHSQFFALTGHLKQWWRASQDSNYPPLDWKSDAVSAEANRQSCTSRKKSKY